MTSLRRAVALLLGLATVLVGRVSWAQQVGDRVTLSGTQSSGVPVHPAAGNTGYVRWPNGTVANVTAIDPQTQWRRVEANGLSGWVVRTYLTVVGEDPAASTNELLTYLVGTWNLEWLSDSKGRGFPENTRGGPTYGSRVNDDYRQIAEVIRDQLGARIMVLSEINGATSTQSNELDRLVGHLGTGWAYFLSTSGAQRLAILYDSRTARRDQCVELTFPARTVQGKAVFDRDPLACAFTFLDGSGAARNDLLVVAVHLASGQQLNVNHDTAMAVLTRRLEQETASGTLRGPERDVLIAGDFNASRYDNYLEAFWDGLSPSRFQLRTLSPADGDEYGGTRLAGVPLVPRSQIDYMMASSQNGGLLSKLAGPFGQVRLDLLPSDYNVFREHLSDHIPVTIRIRVVPDDDPR